MHAKTSLAAAALLNAGLNFTLAQGLDPAVQTKVDAMTKQ